MSQIETVAGCRMPSDHGINLMDKAREDAAKAGSDALRDAILAMLRRQQRARQ